MLNFVTVTKYPKITIDDTPTTDIVDNIISELPLKERASLAYMNEENVEILQAALDKYIGIKTGLAPGDEYHTNIMNELWERLQTTHRIRIVKG